MEEMNGGFAMTTADLSAALQLTGDQLVCRLWASRRLSTIDLSIQVMLELRVWRWRRLRGAPGGWTRDWTRLGGLAANLLVLRCAQP